MVSVLSLWLLSSSRTRAASLGHIHHALARRDELPGEQRTVPVAPSTAHSLGLNSLAQSTATACEPRCGSIPITNMATSSWWLERPGGQT
jgi:hypothetical protein